MVQCRPLFYTGGGPVHYSDEGSNAPTKIPVWGLSLGRLPGWFEAEVMSAVKIQVTGTPDRQIWCCVAMGSITRAKSLFAGLPLFLSWARMLEVMVTATHCLLLEAGIHQA